MLPGIAGRNLQNPAPASLLAYWLAAATQGFLAVASILSGGTAPGSAFWQSLSPSRLLLAAIILIPTAVFVILAICHVLKQAKYNRLAARLERNLQQPERRAAAMAISTVIFITGVYLISVTPEISEPLTQSLLVRLMPLLVWISGLASQTLIFLLAPHLSRGAGTLFSTSKVFLLCLVLFALVLAGWAWVVQNTLALESQVRGWNAQGVPLLETQVFLAWLCGLALLGILSALEQPALAGKALRWLEPGRLDFILAVLLWGFAVILWQSAPLYPNWFVTEGRPPNFEPYPNSDAFHYDLSAQNALVGEGFIFFDSPYIRRPLHAAFLTLLHVLGGQDYNRVVFLQILVLAIFPVLGFLATRTLHNRFSGVILAVLLILREANSIAVSGNITASHVKLLMVDMPATVMVAGFVLTVLRWLKQFKQGHLKAVFSGGFLGACVLLRAELFIFFAPITLLVILLAKSEKQRGLWLKHSLLFLWGAALVVTPWVLRNYALTGMLVLDSPIARFDLVEQRYQLYQTDTQTAPTPQPASSPEPVSSGTAATPEVSAKTELPPAPEPTQRVQQEQAYAKSFISDVLQRTTDFIRKYPEQVARFILSHFANSQVQTLLNLPASIRPLDSLVGFAGHRSAALLWQDCCSLQNYIRRLPFWHKWDGRLPLQTLLPLAIHILLVAWGLQTAWRKHSWTGVTPIFLAVTFLLLNALFRNSGGRYILPVDWIILLYFSIGLASITTRLFKILFGFRTPALLAPSTLDTVTAAQLQDHNQSAQPGVPSIFRQRSFYALCLALFLCSSLIPLTEQVFAQRFTETRHNQMRDSLLQAQGITPGQQANIDTLLQNGGVTLSGRALYPRFFREYLGEPGTGNPFGPRPYPRLAFQLAGPTASAIELPLQNKPSSLPHASDVLLVGCSKTEILGVAVFDSAGRLKAYYERAPLPLAQSCPFPAQDLSVSKKKTNEEP